MADDSQDVSRVRREISALLLLCVIAALAFAGTRQIALWQRARNLRDAAAWYQQGTVAAGAGRHDAAVDAFRRAYNERRDSRQYTVALAGALAAAGQPRDAAAVLTTLRERSPEDSGINLELARVAATRGDVEEAVRYYHSALYGVWPAGQEADRRAARVALVRFLLRHDRRSDAVGELIALTSNIADTAANRVEAGQLMLAADEPRRALEQFQHGLALDPASAAARSGAGEAAFLLANYPEARRYLQELREPSARDVERREMATEVLTRNPLAPRLRSSERRQRVAVLSNRQRARVTACLVRTPPPAAADLARLEAARRDLDRIDGAFRSRQSGDGAETIESAVDALWRVEQTVTEVCGEPSMLDKALALIHRASEAGAQ